ILGAASIQIDWGGRRVVFSGDVGRFNDPMMFDPTTIEETNYLVVESTYGDRAHEATSAEDALAEIVNKTIHRGGTVVIPAFAVGRAQSVLFYIERLKHAGRLPNTLQVFLD